jgi:hypothetical protein
MATLTSGEGRDALNQKSVPQSTSPAVIAASSASAPAAPASAEVAATSKLTLQQYASLCAELAVFKDRTESIFQRYGLATLRDRLNVDLGWQERLRQNPAEQAGWEALYRRWLAHFEEEKGA